MRNFTNSAGGACYGARMLRFRVGAVVGAVVLGVLLRGGAAFADEPANEGANKGEAADKGEAANKGEAADKGEAAASLDADGQRAVDSLMFDVRKVVEVQASSGWKIDRYEYEKMMPDTLLSVCRTTDETRSLALAALGREVTRLGGPPRHRLATVFPGSVDDWRLQVVALTGS